MMRANGLVCLTVGFMGMLSPAGAQEPRISPPATCQVVLNDKQISIAYSRPSIRGRKIMGGLVPYGEVWRTGANESTSFKTAVDLLIGGTKVPAGTYTLYTLPSEGGWKLIINKQTGQWGTEYDQSQDFARVDLTRTTLTKPVETFTMALDKKNASTADLVLTWELTKLSVTLKAQ